MGAKKSFIITTMIGAGVNLVLFLVKLYIGVSTNCLSIYVDSLNNMADTFVCIIATLGFAFIGAKSSEKYPFGLGRAEDIASFLTSLVILGTGCGFAYMSLQRIMYPVPVWYSTKYAVIIALTALVKPGLALFYKVRNKKQSSPVIKALYLDSILDFFITLSTLISFTVTAKSGFALDGILGLVISIVLIVSGVKAVAAAVSTILGKREEQIQQVKEVIQGDDSVITVSQIMCHSYGRRKYYCAKVTTNCTTANGIFDMTTRLEDKIKTEFDADLTLSATENK